MRGKKIGVIGSGSWATAIVKILTDNNVRSSWWVKDEERVKSIQKFRRNPKYLTGADLEVENIIFYTDLKRMIQDADLLIVVVPSAFLHATFRDLPLDVFRGKIVFSSVKGVIPEFDQIPAHYFRSQFNVKYRDIGIIAGPCHAEEIAMQRLSYLTLACKGKRKAKYLASKMQCRYVKTTYSDDVVGMEISAILKNVFAIASGICHGLGYGDNFQAVLVSNSIQEISRFVDVMKPIHRDVKTSAYLGDLLVTAYSQFSRNRRLGNMIGKGYTVDSAIMEMTMVAEGYYAVNSIVKMNRRKKVSMPITDAVYRILYQGASPEYEMRKLTDKLS